MTVRCLINVIISFRESAFCKLTLLSIFFQSAERLLCNGDQLPLARLLVTLVRKNERVFSWNLVITWNQYVYGNEAQARALFRRKKVCPCIIVGGKKSKPFLDANSLIQLPVYVKLHWVFYNYRDRITRQNVTNIECCRFLPSQKIFVKLVL